ncbi:MAG: amidohydrolase family protein, partial [Mycobacterium sp.]
KAMRAAVSRTTGGGTVLGADEYVPARDALGMFLGAADAPVVQRRIAPGQPGDLCILSASPDEVLAELDSGMVTATIIAGAAVYGG